MNTASSLLAIALYTVATGLLWQEIRQGHPRYKVALWLGVLAALSHGAASYTGLITATGMNISLSQVSILISWFVVTLTLLSGIIRPLLSILVAIFPFTAALLLINLLAGSPPKLIEHPGGVLSHIVLSLLSYSVLTIAAIQAVTLAIQEYRLKHHQLRGILRVLPPLVTMEDMLFELVLIGFVLLTLSIGTGVYYVDDLFAQHLVHKSVFSILAWLCFGTLLIGRHQLGWRSRTAIRWTLLAFALLLIGYLGSKFVLEVLLQRS
ncbi:MAG TPA: phosphohydrolase [Spongiibacteraceae bacterium]|nr:phosphohydrolase [Spongiibacteraceae bacterium]HCS29114.1 phosphohydrolase [Spongiibacteraceae bacterium]